MSQNIFQGKWRSTVNNTVLTITYVDSDAYRFASSDPNIAQDYVGINLSEKTDDRINGIIMNHVHFNRVCIDYKRSDDSLRIGEELFLRVQ
jgi:hypothetical protein